MHVLVHGASFPEVFDGSVVSSSMVRGLGMWHEQGIQQQHTIPYTPQQNVVDEQKNHTLKEMANYVIQSKGLSIPYWVETINCAN